MRHTRTSCDSIRARDEQAELVYKGLIQYSISSGFFQASLRFRVIGNRRCVCSVLKLDTICSEVERRDDWNYPAGEDQRKIRIQFHSRYRRAKNRRDRKKAGDK